MFTIFKNLKAAIIYTFNGIDIFSAFNSLDATVAVLIEGRDLLQVKVQEEQVKITGLDLKIVALCASASHWEGAGVQREKTLKKLSKEIRETNNDYNKAKEAHLAGDTPCVDEYFGKE